MTLLYVVGSIASLISLFSAISAFRSKKAAEIVKADILREKEKIKKAIQASDAKNTFYKLQLVAQKFSAMGRGTSTERITKELKFEISAAITKLNPVTQRIENDFLIQAQGLLSKFESERIDQNKRQIKLDIESAVQQALQHFYNMQLDGGGI